MIATIAAVLPSGCLLETATTVCESTGKRCRQGQVCTTDGQCVFRDSCGDGVVRPDRGELCDDGNRQDGDGCDNNCTPTSCGNNVPTADEECDDGNTDSGDGCDSNCTKPRCGNSVAVYPEECDDGNGSNEDDCPNTCLASRCGDGHVNAVTEKCDDRNNATETCNYGALECDVCNDQCQEIEGKISYCGDGITQPAHEECDDGNHTSCGTCNEYCQDNILRHEIGYIAPVQASDIRQDDPADPSPSRDRFTLRDGNLNVNFEYTFTNPPPPNTPELIFIQLVTSDTQPVVAVKTRDAINSYNYVNNPLLRIEASLFGMQMNTKFVQVKRTLPGDLEDPSVSIDENVANPAFLVSGMEGGAGELCPAGTSCTNNEDCETSICVVIVPMLIGICQ